jgi:hypothetical protein
LGLTTPFLQPAFYYLILRKEILAAGKKFIVKKTKKMINKISPEKRFAMNTRKEVEFEPERASG